MAINKAISSKNAVLMAKFAVGLEGTTYFDANFKLWAKRCDERIGITEDSLQIKVICGKIDECRFELQCDTMAVYPAIFQGELKCVDCESFYYAFQKQIGGNIVNSPRSLSIYYNENTFQYFFSEFVIIDNKIVFPHSNFNGKTISIITLARRTDEEGYIYTHPEYIQAMVEYLTWNYAKRTRFTGIPYRFKSNEINEMEREYHKQVRNAVAESSKDSPDGSKRMEDLINNAFSGTAHSGWMLNNIYEI